jgi:hypothetical protein
MHTSESNPLTLERKEPDSTQGGTVAEPTAPPGQTSPLNRVPATAPAEVLTSKARRTSRLLDAMMHWALSR